MSGSGKKRTPLVADKRYPNGAAKKPAGKKVVAKRKPAAKTSRKRKPARKHGLLWRLTIGVVLWVVALVWRLAWRAGVVGALILAGWVGYYAMSLPPAIDLLDARARGSVTLMDRNGEVFAWRGEQFGGIVTTDTVSPHLKNAVVATEDKRFYSHFGLSPRGVASAIRINLREGRGPLSGHGGSTITQQTAKLLCMGNPYDPASGLTEAEYEADCRQSSLKRKAIEAVYALAMEVRYSKDTILTIYLNRAYTGAGSRGFEAASQRYFGKSAAEVTPAEAAMLAGLLTAPSRYAPTANLQRSQDRAAVIINLMEEQGYLTTAEAAHARANPAILSEAAQAKAGGYFADWVMDAGPAFLTRDTTEDVIIRTTFDQDIQNAAEAALEKVFAEKVSEGSQAQAAIVVMSADGAVRAMVGGRKVRGIAGQFNRAIQANRQTGSAFKPFVYAAALDLGYRYDDTVIDEPITLDVPGSGPWSPSNYDNDFRGPVTLTDALKYSLNIPAVKISEAVGRDNVRLVAQTFGLSSDLADGPALALGASETTLLEMTAAYAGILNGGSSVTPYGLIELRLQGDNAPLMDQSGGIGERVITPDSAQQLVYMMHQVVQGGTGSRAALPGREVAGKTGTSTAARDAWFIGFTADYVAGVWMGYDDNTPLKGVTGSGLPAEIWRETMAPVQALLPARPLPMIRPAELPRPRMFETRGGPPTEPVQPQPGQGDNFLIDLLGAILGNG